MHRTLSFSRFGPQPRLFTRSANFQKATIALNEWQCFFRRPLHRFRVDQHLFSHMLKGSCRDTKGLAHVSLLANRSTAGWLTRLKNLLSLLRSETLPSSGNFGALFHFIWNILNVGITSRYLNGFLAGALLPLGVSSQSLPQVLESVAHTLLATTYRLSMWKLHYIAWWQYFGTKIMYLRLHLALNRSCSWDPI